MRNTRQPSMRPVIVNALYVLILLPFVMLLKGCATNKPMPPPELPRLPHPPSLTTPLPSQPYLKTVEQRMQRWEKSLSDTQMMREPSSKPGL